MEKITVAVCDDAPFISNHISKFIKSNFEECIVVGVFSDGSEALEYMKSKPVDLIITDIRMSKVSGLDLAKYVFENMLPTRVIIITAFQEFEYARKAINYNVSDFLCKPINPNELKQSVQSNIKTIKKLKEKAIEKCYQTVENYIRNSVYLKNLFFDSKFDKKSSRESSEFHSLATKENSALLFFFYSNTTNNVTESNLNDIAAFSSDNLDAYPLYAQPHESAVILFYNSESDIEKYIDTIIKGFSLLYNTESDYIRVNQGSFRNIFDVICQYDIPACFDILIDKKSEQWTRKLKEIEKNGSFESYRLFLVIMVLLFDFRARGIDTPFYIPALTDADSKQFLSDIAKQISDVILQKDLREESIKSKIEAYVFSHLSDCELGLVMIATEFHYSPEYFSRWFKKNFGVNFHQYITDLRIDYAKKLLKSGKDSKDVPALVGFKTRDHFTKTFKKAVNLTPKEYSMIEKGRET